MPQTVAVFVDGDNLSGRHAEEIIHLGRSFGALRLARAYGGEHALSHWADQPGFQFVFSGSGKNAADLHLAIDAVDFSIRQGLDTVLLCSSDGDFLHLARYLRENGTTVIGFVDETKATDRFQAAFHAVHFSSPAQKPDPAKPAAVAAQSLDHKIRSVIAANSKNGEGVPIVELSATMYKKHGIRISQQPERTWRAYLGKRTTKFELDPRGPDAKVRFLPSGF